MMSDDNLEEKQTMKATLAIWRDAVTLYARGQFSESIATYGRLNDISARMLYNMMCACVKIGDIKEAIKLVSAAVVKDEFLAIAFFQRGVLYLKSARLKEALPDFQQAKMLLRGNSFIDYRPLGLLARLYMCDVLYNTALVYLLSNDVAMCRLLLTEAKVDADDTQLKCVQEALNAVKSGEYGNLTPRLISMDKIFSPPKSVTKNLEKTQMKTVGKAKVVSASDSLDRDRAFNFSRRMKELKFEMSPKPKRTYAIKKTNTGAIRGRSVSDVGVPSGSSLKHSKSMSDVVITAEKKAALSETCPNPNSPTLLAVPGAVATRRSTDDLQASQTGYFKGLKSDLSKTATPQRSPITKLRRLLKKKTERRSDPLNDNYPSPKMRFSKSMGDIFTQVNMSTSGADQSLSQSLCQVDMRRMLAKPLSAKSSSAECLGVTKNGAHLVDIQRGLANLLTVATSPATPKVIINEAVEGEHVTQDAHVPGSFCYSTESLKDYSDADGKVSFFLNEDDNTVNSNTGDHVNDTRNNNDTTAVKHVYVNGVKNNTRTNNVDQTDAAESNNQMQETEIDHTIPVRSINQKCGSTTSTLAKSTCTRRPPPPSYPPPPLPANFVIHV